MTKASYLGFIGLGVMGRPMCMNLARKSGRPVVGFDLRNSAPEGVLAARSAAEVARRADIVFLSLPGEAEIRSVLREVPLDRTVVDCSTAPTALAKELATRYADFADAPVARTRQAAIDGTLSIMVGASPALYARVEPLLRCMGSEVTHCGPPGAGQAVKLLNNMVLSVTVLALAEALAVAKASGAVAAGLELQGAGTAQRLLEQAVALGLCDAYHTAILEAVRKHAR